MTRGEDDFSTYKNFPGLATLNEFHRTEKGIKRFNYIDNFRVSMFYRLLANLANKAG